MDSRQGITFQTESDPGQITRWVAAFLESRGAYIEQDSAGDRRYPVVLSSVDSTVSMSLDVSSVPFLAAGAEQKPGVRISTFKGNTRITTGMLKVLAFEQMGSKKHCTVEYPRQLTVEFRRHEFRAELRSELDCKVVVSGPGVQRDLVGELRDLSVCGCQLKLPLRAANLQAGDAPDAQLLLLFPNGQSLALAAWLRYCQVAAEEACVYCGFEFTSQAPGQERELWSLVREIERECARNAGDARGFLPSPLFIRLGEGVDSAQSDAEYPTVTARLLAPVAHFIGVQVVALKNGSDIDANELSRHSDLLLRLLHSDREEVLFALSCLDDYPALITHCLGVAVWLADVALNLDMPQATVKAITASALVHDLGKVLLPSASGADRPSGAGSDVAQHVALLLSRMTSCRWLSAQAQSVVVAQINERLDGSGYPGGWTGSQLSEPGKLAAVIDHIHTARVGSRLEPPMAYGAIKAQLMQQTACFDEKWIRYCFRHFGKLPVGALVETATGERGWVRRRDSDGNCSALVPCLGNPVPRGENLAVEIVGNSLTALGLLREVSSGS